MLYFGAEGAFEIIFLEINLELKMKPELLLKTIESFRREWSLSQETHSQLEQIEKSLKGDGKGITSPDLFWKLFFDKVTVAPYLSSNSNPGLIHLMYYLIEIQEDFSLPEDCIQQVMKKLLQLVVPSDKEFKGVQEQCRLWKVSGKKCLALPGNYEFFSKIHELCLSMGGLFRKRTVLVLQDVYFWL